LSYRSLDCAPIFVTRSTRSTEVSVHSSTPSCPSPATAVVATAAARSRRESLPRRAANLQSSRRTHPQPVRFTTRARAPTPRSSIDPNLHNPKLNDCAQTSIKSIKVLGDGSANRTSFIAVQLQRRRRETHAPMTYVRRGHRLSSGPLVDNSLYRDS
jgi:hypothetical protein